MVVQNNTLLSGLQKQILDAADNAKALQIVGGGTKAFYGRATAGEILSVADYSGIVSYQPSELVITAKAGTPLREIHAALSENNQQLGFEPPDFGSNSTLGGVIASGFSGPCRPYYGAAQDFVLGIKLMSGRGEILNFGGRVIKNVAGFDASRLMVGALGCLGVLLEISLKVIPIPALQKTVLLEHREVDDAVSLMNQLAAQPIPLSACSWCAHQTRIRLSGTENGVSDAVEQINQTAAVRITEDAEGYWSSVNNTTHKALSHTCSLYRVSVAPSSSGFTDTPALVDWGGAVRWYQAEGIEQKLQESVKSAHGHLTIFRNGDRNDEVIAPVSPAMMKIQQKLKTVFDPCGVLNPGRMYQVL